ncbi:hypothetical protein [Saccharothrix yanglingensis]|nr:hypothetical protein [Saccharothrix yanglingensis]
MALAGLVGATRYTRSSATLRHDEYLPGLLDSGRDGQVVLPKAMGRKQRVGGQPFTRNATVEQVVTTAVRSALDLPTCGIVDQRTAFAPPGPVLVRAGDEWQAVALRLIRHARVLVLPPPDQDEYAHRAALGRAATLLALLEGTGLEEEVEPFRIHDHELDLPATTIVVRCRDDVGGYRAWETVEPPPSRTAIGTKRKSMTTDTTYLGALTEAFRELDHDGWPTTPTAAGPAAAPARPRSRPTTASRRGSTSRGSRTHRTGPSAVTLGGSGRHAPRSSSHAPAGRTGVGAPAGSTRNAHRVGDSASAGTSACTRQARRASASSPATPGPVGRWTLPPDSTSVHRPRRARRSTTAWTWLAWRVAAHAAVSSTVPPFLGPDVVDGGSSWLAMRFTCSCDSATRTGGSRAVDDGST